jgi:hypothetical protein
VGEGALVDDFLEAAAEDTVDFHRTADYLARELGEGIVGVDKASGRFAAVHNVASSVPGVAVPMFMNDLQARLAYSLS